MECWWPERGEMIRSLTGFKSGTGKKKVGQTGFPAAPAVAVKDEPVFLVCKEQVSGKRWELDFGRGNPGVSQSGRVAWATGLLT